MLSSSSSLRQYMPPLRPFFLDIVTFDFQRFRIFISDDEGAETVNDIRNASYRVPALFHALGRQIAVHDIAVIGPTLEILVVTATVERKAENHVLVVKTFVRKESIDSSIVETPASSERRNAV